MGLSVMPHPAPLTAATPRQSLSVTIAAQDPATVCPLALSQEASRERIFPPVASAVIGTLVHAIIEHATRHGVTDIGDPAEALANRCNAWDSDPDGGLRWPQLVPLRRYLVDERRRDALATIAVGIGHSSGVQAASPRPGQASGARSEPDPRKVGRWAEYPIKDEHLGLRGCMDLLVADGAGGRLVIDYKTGFDQEAEDQQGKRAIYHRQVQIYLLMLRRIHPAASLSGLLSGSHGRDPVPWSDALAAQTGDHLGRFRDALAGADIGRTSPSESACMFCPIRHRCSAFRPWVERMRSESGPGFLAGNVWGTVQQPPRLGGHQASMTIRDAAGAVVVINGLALRDGFQDLVQGTPVSIYGLKPERDPEGNIRPYRLWERRSSGRTLCASVVIFSGHPLPAH